MNKLLLLFRISCGLYLILLFNQPLQGQPVNDICETAIEISGVTSDMGFICIPGSNLLAEAEPFNNSCAIGNFPTVWFKVNPDGVAALMKTIAVARLFIFQCSPLVHYNHSSSKHLAVNNHLYHINSCL